MWRRGIDYVKMMQIDLSVYPALFGLGDALHIASGLCFGSVACLCTVNPATAFALSYPNIHRLL